MKKLLSLLAFAAVISFFACEKDEPVDPTPTLNELSGDLTSRTLTSDKKWLLKGQVFVRSGQVLTIEPGTVIFGDKATRGTLVIDKGGKIEAVGTADKPIVFTSNLAEGIRDRGDWGGLVILGRANCNQIDPGVEGITPAVTFGTNNNAANDGESSGTLKYVRVEFAGIELTPNNETNSITMGGVGRGTVMEYCQVSFGGDDGYEWFGGTVNGKYLISFCTWDDDFDVDYGWAGNVQYGLAVRYPGFADQSQSNGFETDNGPNDNDVTPYTDGVFSNMTVVGPIKTGSSTSNANYGHAFDARRRTALSLFNSVLVGFPRGIRFNQPSVLAQYQSGRGVLANNVLVAPATATAYNVGTGVTAADVQAYWTANNTTIDGPASDAIHQALGLNLDVFFGARLADAYTAPDFRVTTGTLATGAAFSNAKFNEANRSAFFNKNVTFRGAFGSTDWTTGWAEFKPVSKAY
ncbi:MAG: hypothetical protein IAE84_03990 [Saprospiraceae bacterium]|jgi:hypothetical protein|nr:hypothetical protein [Saprospiraceae bacterium]HRD80822.1 hypothetical protein [Saprospiraceae bacterium]